MDQSPTDYVVDDGTVTTEVELVMSLGPTVGRPLRYDQGHAVSTRGWLTAERQQFRGHGELGVDAAAVAVGAPGCYVDLADEAREPLAAQLPGRAGGALVLVVGTAGRPRGSGSTCRPEPRRRRVGRSPGRAFWAGYVLAEELRRLPDDAQLGLQLTSAPEWQKPTDLPRLYSVTDSERNPDGEGAGSSSPGCDLRCPLPHVVTARVVNQGQGVVQELDPLQNLRNAENVLMTAHVPDPLDSQQQVSGVCVLRQCCLESGDSAVETNLGDLRRANELCTDDPPRSSSRASTAARILFAAAFGSSQRILAAASTRSPTPEGQSSRLSSRGSAGKNIVGAKYCSYWTSCRPPQSTVISPMTRTRSQVSFLHVSTQWKPP